MPIFNEKQDVFDPTAMEKLRKELRFDPQILKKFRRKFLRNHDGAELSLRCFPEDLRAPIASSVRFHPLTLVQRKNSKQDGATKLLFHTASGQPVETVVLRPETGRTTVCLSSQVGCAAACKFCATGAMGIAKNLTPGEILDQVVQSGELLTRENRRLRNLVFMGMGEPFHNERSLFAAMTQLLSPQYFDWPARRVMVSTVGIPDAMLRFVERFPQVNLAVSLHTTNQVQREELIPLARKYSLANIRATLEAINSIQKKPVMIEYLMLAGVNDSLLDAQQLIEFVAGLRVHVNLIPFNPIASAPNLTSSNRTVRDAFADVIRKAGYVATIRYSLGNDIEAACGQLASKENRVSLPHSRKNAEALEWPKP